MEYRREPNILGSDQKLWWKRRDSGAEEVVTEPNWVSDPCSPSKNVAKIWVFVKNSGGVQPEGEQEADTDKPTFAGVFEQIEQNWSVFPWTTPE